MAFFWAICAYKHFLLWVEFGAERSYLTRPMVKGGLYSLILFLSLLCRLRTQGSVPIFSAKKWERILIISFSCFLLVSPALAFNFMGDWRYFDASGEESCFSQIYSLSLSSQATGAVNMGGTVRYSRSDQGVESQELFTPVAYFSLRNDYFNFDLSATDTERRNSEGPDYSTKSWNIDLNSFYKEIVNVRFYYGSSSQNDDSRPRRIDTKDDYWGFNLGKKWKGLDGYYDYRGSHSEDRVNNAQTDNFSHFFRGEYSGSWHNFSYSFGQQFNYMKTNWEGELQGGKALYPINIGVDWQPSMPDNNSDFNDYIDQVYDKNPEESYGIIIDLGTESIDLIEFYYDSQDWKAVPSDVKWDIYWSRDKITWTLLANNVSLPYEFSPTFSKSRYLKLIPRTKSSQTLKINNPLFKAYRYLSAPKYTSKVHNYRSNVSLNYDFSENISVSYYYSCDRSEPSPGPDTKDIIHTLSGSWWVNKYFQPRLSYSRSKDEREGQPDSIVKSFSASNFSEIFPTLDVSTGYTHTIVEEGGERQSRNDTININTTANIYPDLDVRWDISYSDVYNYLTKKGSKEFYSRLNAIARIKPTITLNSVYQYNYVDSSDPSRSSHYFLFDLNWTLSDFCSVHAMENFLFSDDSTTINSVYSIWISLTSKTQFNFQYSGTRNDTSTDQLSAFFSWRINRHFSFKTSYSWSKVDSETSWSWMFNLTSIF